MPAASDEAATAPHIPPQLPNPAAKFDKAPIQRGLTGDSAQPPSGLIDDAASAPDLSMQNVICYYFKHGKKVLLLALIVEQPTHLTFISKKTNQQTTVLS